MQHTQYIEIVIACAIAGISAKHARHTPEGVCMDGWRETKIRKHRGISPSHIVTHYWNQLGLNELEIFE
jgi:hypothetical protein